MKISIIGAGNMGGAIARGLSKGSIFKQNDITVSDPSQKILDQMKAECPDINFLNDNAEAIKGADIVVVAVKPWLMKIVIDQIKSTIDFSKQVFVSIAAGISFADLEEMFGVTGAPIVRVIPNTAIAIRQSMTMISVKNTSSEQQDTLKNIFDELGKSVIIEERLMGAGTALCSCGIAYAFRYVKASVDGGVEMGFYPEQAKQMIEQTVKGAIELLMANNSMPDEEV